MPNNKIYIFLISLGILGLVHSSLAQESSSASTELDLDTIKAQELGVNEPATLPGQSGHWWTNLKKNMGLFFTLDPEAKIKKMEELASLKLIEAQKLAETSSGTDNAAQQVEKNLAKYQELMKKMAERLEANPELKAKLQERFDANQMRHQQVLQRVADRLSEKDTARAERLLQIRKEQMLRWYNANRETIKERLEKAVESNDTGSKFRQLKNLGVLEELEDIVPTEAQEEIAAAKRRAQEKMAEKMKNISTEDKIRLERYILQMELSDVKKQALLENLKNGEILPPAVKNQLEEISREHAEKIRQRFEKMNDEQKKVFLQGFEGQAEPSKLELLEQIRIPNNLQIRVNELKDDQETQIRMQIRSTNDPMKLRLLQRELQNRPALLREVQERLRTLSPEKRPALLPEIPAPIYLDR